MLTSAADFDSSSSGVMAGAMLINTSSYGTYETSFGYINSSVAQNYLNANAVDWAFFVRWSADTSSSGHSTSIFLGCNFTSGGNATICYIKFDFDPSLNFPQTNEFARAGINIPSGCKSNCHVASPSLFTIIPFILVVNIGIPPNTPPPPPTHTHTHTHSSPPPHSNFD